MSVPGIYIDGKLNKIEHDTIHFEDLRVAFRYDERKRMIELRDALLVQFPLNEEASATCEFCDSPSTTTEQDELGNDCRVCEDHAQTLAASKPERRSDELYDNQKDIG